LGTTLLAAGAVSQMDFRGYAAYQFPSHRDDFLLGKEREAVTTEE
jgi:hypothetical protein